MYVILDFQGLRKKIVSTETFRGYTYQNQFRVIFNLKKKKNHAQNSVVPTLLQIQPWEKTIDKRRPRIHKRRNICFYYLKRFN